MKTAPLRPPLRALALLLTALLALHGCASSQRSSAPRGLAPPVAPREPSIRMVHGEVFVDDYAWLRDRDDPRTIAYLNAENRYTERMTAHTEPLRRRLYEEMLARLEEEDVTAPVRQGDWWYCTRTKQGLPYPVLCRRRGGPDGPEEIILDCNALAKGLPYFGLGMSEVSEDGAAMAVSIDADGAERFEARFLRLPGGEEFGGRIGNTAPAGAWANDGRYFFYLTLDHTNRPHRLWRRDLGASPPADELVHEETDERFYMNVARARQGRFILVHMRSMASDEWLLIDADDPLAPPRTVAPRRQGVEYSVDVGPDRLYIVTNDGAPNFRVVQAPIDDPSPANWRDAVPHSDAVTIDEAEAFAHHLVVHERAGGLQRIRVRRHDGRGEHLVSFDEPAYALSPGDNRTFDTRTLRFEYSSPATPRTTIDYDMETRQRTIVKRVPVPGHDPSRVIVERRAAPAPDGAMVPITIVRPRGAALDGSAPGYLYGYGSYGYSIDPSFRADIYSLVDRGVVCAIAHIRGGSELGRAWYEAGRLRHKMNTFTDFIACAEFLTNEGYTAPGRLAVHGGSAGGLLIGAVVNMRPDLFACAVADVPFVDVVNTMLDPTIPLTVTEWEQWGDPRRAEDYGWIRAYSPYDNLRRGPYPPMLVLAGLNDPRVAYWEPAKWVARLRAHKTDANPLLLRTNMDAGHGGASGRYERMRERAFTYAFILDALGAAER